MSWIEDTLLQLEKQLFPEGRAFRMPTDSIFERLQKALNVSKARAYEDAVSILKDIIPDNDQFSEDDATQWERRLAIFGNSSIPLADRKLAILQKMAYPGIEEAPRQAASFLESQLRAAGYDVYVYENRFLPGPVTKTPGEVLGTFVGLAGYGLYGYGEIGYGTSFADSGVTVIANYIEEEKDELFVIGDNYRSTFFIAGNPITSFATVDANRKIGFRQMILQYKPAQTVGFLFVNYL